MRYNLGIAIFVAYLDTENQRSHTRFTFKGDVDFRRVRRMLRARLNELGMRPKKAYLDFLIKHRSYELGT